MWGKIRTIAGTNIYVTFTDVGALFFILALPVFLSVIIGLAFGEGNNTIDLGTSELAIVNQDETVSVGGENGAPQRQVNWGQQMYADVLLNDVPPDLAELINAQAANDVGAARQQVEDGELDAVLIIPPEFTANVLDPEMQGEVELYYNPANEITVTILLTVVEQLTAQINTGESAQDILVESDEPYLISTGTARGQSTEQISTAAGDVLQQLFAEGAPQVVTLNSVDIEGEARSFDSLSYFAPSMAILFMTFAMATGMRSILEENRNWTMQRLLTTPTPRWAYMAGKMLGTFATGVVQMVLLIFITMGVAAILGRNTAIWGSNIPGLVLVIVTVVAAASALGLLLTAFSRSVRQADNVSNAVLIVMAMIGGSFVSIEGNDVLDLLSNLSLNKWGIEGFVELADGGAVTDIIPSLLALSAMTVLFFGGALFAFSQRDDL